MSGVARPLAGARLERFRALDMLRKALVGAAVTSLAASWILAWSLRMHAVWLLLAASVALAFASGYVWLRLHGLVGLLGPKGRRLAYRLSLRDLARRVSRFLWESQGTMLLLRLFFWAHGKAEVRRLLRQMPPGLREAVERKGVVYFVAGDSGLGQFVLPSWHRKTPDSETGDDGDTFLGVDDSHSSDEDKDAGLAPTLDPLDADDASDEASESDLSDDGDDDREDDGGADGGLPEGVAAGGAAGAPSQRYRSRSHADPPPLAAAASASVAAAAGKGKRNALADWAARRLAETLRQVQASALQQAPPVLRWLGSPAALRALVIAAGLTGVVHAMATRSRTARKVGSFAIDLSLAAGTTLGLAGLGLAAAVRFQQRRRQPAAAVVAPQPTARRVALSSVVVALWLLRIWQHRRRNQLRVLKFRATRGL